MKRSHLESTILFLLIPLLAGCKYNRSFMQMDSNSGSPFFGLQFAVDSGTRPPRKNSEATMPGMPFRKENHRIESLISPQPEEVESLHRLTLVSQRHDAVGPSLEPTSRTATFNGRIRYSIPQENSEHRSIAKRVDMRLSSF